MAIITGAGTALQVSISSSYTNVANVYSIGGPQITVTDIETTILLSSNFFKEFISGFGDGGTVQIEAYQDGAQMATLYGMLRVVQAWRIVFVDNSKWDFNGRINAIGSNIEREDAVTMPFGIKVSGKPTFTA